MQIKDEVKHVYMRPIDEYGQIWGDADDHINAIINAYLKSVWKPFDKDDESTLPKRDRGYFVRTEYGCGFGVYVKHPDEEPYWRVNIVGDVIAYLDPADILPEEEE